MNDVYKCPTCNDIRVYLTDSYAKQERAAIVAWLGTEACYNTLRSHEWNLAAAIERGEHLRGDDE